MAFSKVSAFLLLTPLLQTTASPLVVGENGMFDQGFLSNFRPSTSKFSSSPIPSTENSDTIFPSDSEAETTSYPSWFTSTLMARRMLALSTSGIASTNFPTSGPPNAHTPSDVAGTSIPLREYIADCDASLPSSDGRNGEGNPTLLALPVGTTFRNTAAGSNISLAIDWWDHLNDTEPIYPGFPLSPAGLPRATLIGTVEPFETPVSAEMEEALEKCFLAAHPDAEAWLPNKKGSPHASFWARMVVNRVYWIGGFGDVQHIGWMNVTEWRGIRREKSLPGIGDGRGWEDVRLPGEK